MVFKWHMLLKSQEGCFFILSSRLLSRWFVRLYCKDKFLKFPQNRFSNKLQFVHAAVLYCTSLFQKHSSAQIDRCLFKGTVHAEAVFFFREIWTEISGFFSGIMLLLGIQTFCSSLTSESQRFDALFSLKSIMMIFFNS